MEYDLEIRGQTIPVEVEQKEDRQLEVTVGGNRYKVEYTRISNDHIHLTIDGKNSNVFLAEDQNGKTVFINGNAFTVTDQDRRVRNRIGRGVSGKTPHIVTPPMPALVVAVLVQTGDRVNKGDGVIIVSAMKMETTLTAPYDGRVNNVPVSPGDKVKPGEVLINIEKDG